ncbi:MAG: alpha/beta hydrolase, partial [Kofleriaceae bacterium]
GADRFALGADRRTRLPLPGVDCFAIAGTTATEEHARLPGDGMVGVASALGQHDVHGLVFSKQWIAFGVGHIDLLDAPAVYAKLLEWLAHK